MWVFKFVTWPAWAGLVGVAVILSFYWIGRTTGEYMGTAKATQEAIERTNKSIEGLSNDAEKVADAFRFCRLSGGVWDYTKHKCVSK